MASTTPDNQIVEGFIHDEAYLAMKPLLMLMQLFGLYNIPIKNKKIGDDLSEVDQLKFRRGSKLLFLFVLSICGISCVWIFGIFDYSIHILDPVESFVTSFVTGIMCLVAYINVFQAMYQGPKWHDYFKKWQILDSYLDITWDQKLRKFVKSVSVSYVIYASVALGAALYASTLTLNSHEDSVNYVGKRFVIATLGYSIFINGCQLLPEILFSCFAVAIKLRISFLTNKIKQNFEVQAVKRSESETSKILEELRIVFQSLMGVIKSTNAMMGPNLFSCIFTTTAYLSSIIFVVLFQAMDNIGVVISEVIYSTFCILRLMSICFFADQIRRQVNDLKRAIYLIPVVQQRFSQNSMDEHVFFVKCIKKSTVSFSALDFISVDKELFTKVVGAILTYTVTILEFYEKQKKEEPFNCIDSE